MSEPRASAVRYGPSAYADVLGVLWGKEMTRNAIANALNTAATRHRFTIARMHAAGLIHISGAYRGYPLFKVGEGVDKFDSGTDPIPSLHAERFRHLWDVLSTGPMSRDELAETAGVPYESARLFIKYCHRARIIHVAFRDRGACLQGLHTEIFEIGRKKDAPAIRPQTSVESSRRYREAQRELTKQRAMTNAFREAA